MSIRTHSERLCSFNVILFSGGLDSLCTALKCPGHSWLFIDYGQPYAEAELGAIRNLQNLWDKFWAFRHDAPRLPPFRQFKTSMSGYPDSPHVPYRNLLLMTSALNHLMSLTEKEAVDFGGRLPSDHPIIKLKLGALADDRVKDQSGIFYTTATAALSQADAAKVTVSSEFHDLAKAEMVEDTKMRFAMEQGAHGVRLENLLYAAFSCFKPIFGSTPCGNCPACFRKAVAMVANDYNDLGEYSRNPLTSMTAIDYWKRRALLPELFHPARRKAMDKAWLFVKNSASNDE